MNIPDFLFGPLGWCPRFNITGWGSVEDRYEGNRALLYISIAVTVGTIALSIPLIIGVQQYPLSSFDREVQAALALIFTGGSMSGNLARVQWKVRSASVSRSDWRIIRRVFVYSFAFIIAITTAAWLILPSEAYWPSYPIIFWTSAIFNRLYGKWALRDARTVSSPEFWAGIR